MSRFAAPLACFPVALLLSATAADPADNRIAMSNIATSNILASTVQEAPEIPGITYPRKAPPDLATSRIVADAHIDAREPAVLTPKVVPADNSDAPAGIDITSLKLEVDLTRQQLRVVEHGALKHTWPISSGRPGHNTKTGTFRPQWASRMWYSRQYDLTPMPHAVFFNGGIAFHATNATHLLGRPASHGCVRLAPQNARALYALVHQHGYPATEITVAGNPLVTSSAARKSRSDGDRRQTKPEKVSVSTPTSWTFF